MLLELGVELGDDARPGETYGEYALRVWGDAVVTDPTGVPTADALTRQPGRR